MDINNLLGTGIKAKIKYMIGLLDLHINEVKKDKCTIYKMIFPPINK